MEKLVVVSPHLDDAVFGCSELLAAHPGAIVVTLFCGLPDATAPLPEWDATCGFASARGAMQARRREDRSALRILGATPCWLHCHDAQYRRGAQPEGAARKLARALRRHEPDMVAIPAGLFHEDHKIAHEAALGMLRLSRRRRWVLYEDALYRRIPGLLEERVARLERAGLSPCPLDERPRACLDTKRRAVECYGSQLRGLVSAGRPGHDDLFERERYWSLAP
jgi:LmbE family N-acetylglucosaminyl deacetylase